MKTTTLEASRRQQQVRSSRSDVAHRSAMQTTPARYCRLHHAAVAGWPSLRQWPAWRAALHEVLAVLAVRCAQVKRLHNPVALPAGTSKKRGRQQKQQQEQEQDKHKHGGKHKHKHGKKHHHHHHHTKKHKAAGGKDDRPHYGDMTGPLEQDVWQSDDSDKVRGCWLDCQEGVDCTVSALLYCCCCVRADPLLMSAQALGIVVCVWPVCRAVLLRPVSGMGLC